MAQKQNHSTPSEKAAALRAAKLQNVKASATAMQEDPSARPARQAKSAAYKNQVWMAEKSGTRKRASSNLAESDHIKQARTGGSNFSACCAYHGLTGIPYDMYDAETKPPIHTETKPPTHIKQNGPRSAAELFDSDSDVKEASDESDEYKLQGGSEDDLNDSEDDLQALKGDSRKLKEVLDLERPQFSGNSTRSRSNSFSSRKSFTTSSTSVPDSDIEADSLYESKSPPLIANTNAPLATTEKSHYRERTPKDPKSKGPTNRTKSGGRKIRLLVDKVEEEVVWGWIVLDLDRDLQSTRSISVPPTGFVNVPYYNVSILVRPPRILVPATVTSSEQTQDILIHDTHQHQPQPETNTNANADPLAHAHPVPPSLGAPSSTPGTDNCTSIVTYQEHSPLSSRMPPPIQSDNEPEPPTRPKRKAAAPAKKATTTNQKK
ncbi:hypothetical protein M405DRAFT_867126 [Rhizopogon salebrosus TDB-379]|nr:hypothetical protein M405DRAFT_867126 [Rhizopogon salebrosus TDB-379]